MRTNASQRPTLKLVGGGGEESGSAYANSGLKRAGSITSQRTRDQVLSELLNDLESQVQILESKYLEACVTLITVTHRLVELGNSIKDITTTEGESVL